MSRHRFHVLSTLLLSLALLVTGCASPQERLATTVNLNLVTEPPTLDPHLAAGSPSVDIIGGLFSGLTEIDEQTMEPIPKLATEWQVSDDGVTWHGHVLLDERPGVSYPDAVEGDGGRIYVIYDHNRTTDREILMATFTESDVAAGRCTSPDARLRVVVSKGTGVREAPG